MAKKKSKGVNDKQLFDKRADIITDNDGRYHIRKNRIYICGSDYYGKVYTITSNKYSKDNVHIIKEFYPYDNKRLRFLIVNFKNARKFKTREKLPDGTERKINVIESYTDVSEYVCSIGDIKHFTSDLGIQTEIAKEKPFAKARDNIRRLILKPEETKTNKKDKSKRKAA